MAKKKQGFSWQIWFSKAKWQAGYVVFAGLLALAVEEPYLAFLVPGLTLAANFVKHKWKK